MESISALQITTYVLCGVILIGFLYKIVGFVRMPPHLRWELYPLAGEVKRKYGGSYLEEPEWWKNHSEDKSMIKELMYIFQEILLFREYLHRNRSFWYVVYPFHLAVFLFAGFFVLLIIGALTMVGGIAVSASSANAWGVFLHYLTLIAGVAGFISGTLACLILIIRKLTDQNLRAYARRVEYFNLVFILAVFVTGLSAWAFADTGFNAARAYTYGLITGSSIGNVSGIIAAHVMLLVLLLAYMPLTSMMHFVAKFFTFHSVRWDDKPNFKGSEMERKLRPLLGQEIGWEAPHLQSIRVWSDVVAATSPEGTPKRHVEKDVNK